MNESVIRFLDADDADDADDANFNCPWLQRLLKPTITNYHLTQYQINMNETFGTVAPKFILFSFSPPTNLTIFAPY